MLAFGGWGGKRVARALAIACLAFSSPVGAVVVSDIRVEGLQRISAGTVFNAITYGVGDDLGPGELRAIIRSLFDTELFDDVQVSQDGDVLVITVQERPTISSIEFDGNKAIKTEALLEGLSESGLAEGQIFKKVTLEHIASDLERQYVAQGRYDARIETEVEDLPRNRVAIKVEVYEGQVSGIRHINIVGNSVFDNQTLTDLLELKLPSFFSWYTKADQYSREKLKGDLESLESWYLDRGYLDFAVDSTQVSIAPNMEDVYITINISEGEQYIIRGVDIAGELRDIPEATIRALLITAEGQIFSRELMTTTEERIEAALGNAGYTFASATGEPVPNEDGEGVTLRYFIDAGQRAYVRRISFQGNTVTQDSVLRREMRQMEGGWASNAYIEGSKIRLERLGYFKEVNVETPTVPGTEDQIDVNYTVEEQPSGSISATLGYAQQVGLIVGVSYQESNVFGSGNSVSVNLNRSSYQEAVSLSFFDPYFTVNGVSLGYSLFYTERNYDEQNLVRYSTNTLGLSANFGYPISEVSRVNFGLGYENTEITGGAFDRLEIREFLESQGASSDDPGKPFDLFTFTASYSMSALNRGLLPTAGRSQAISVEATFPGSDLEFYRVTYNGQIFFPLWNPFTLRLRAEIGYGDTYGDTTVYPFYKNFFGGGMGSVRGFESYSLGPKATPGVPIPGEDISNRDPIGGNLLVELSAEVLFPLPFVEDQRQIKSVFFIDAGNVYNTNCVTPRMAATSTAIEKTIPEPGDMGPLPGPDYGEPQMVTVRAADPTRVCAGFGDTDLRLSAGIAFTWITGLAPISFALSVPLTEEDGDETESFQFELGRTF